MSGINRSPVPAPYLASLADLEDIARRLSEAHDVLLKALESAEKG